MKNLDILIKGLCCMLTKVLINVIIGTTVTVTVDRPLGSYHPEHKDMYYPVNYGYIEEIMALDGEEQDAYILGVNEPVDKFTGKIIAIVHRKDDIEEKWVVVPDGITFSKEEIRSKYADDRVAYTNGKQDMMDIILNCK